MNTEKIINILQKGKELSRDGYVQASERLADYKEKSETAKIARIHDFQEKAQRFIDDKLQRNDLPDIEDIPPSLDDKMGFMDLDRNGKSLESQITAMDILIGEFSPIEPIFIFLMPIFIMLAITFTFGLISLLIWQGTFSFLVPLVALGATYYICLMVKDLYTVLAKGVVKLYLIFAVVAIPFCLFILPKFGFMRYITNILH